jgi:archaetidylserine synthase
VIADRLDTKDFIGFPIPGISFAIATFYLSGLFNPYVALILSAIISVLMISNIRYPKFDNIPVIAISAVLIAILILPINVILFNINLPALILLLFCLYYLIINLIKR